MEPKIEPTLENEKKENPSRGVLDSNLLASQEKNREISREDIAGVCNESFLFQGHTISTLEEYIKNARSAEDFHYVVDALEYLKRRTENEPYHELTGDDLVPLLESIAQRDISYFVRESARVNLRVPLDSLSLRYKRSLLQREFENIQQEGVATDLFGHAIVRSPADIDALDDATVLRAFRCYGEINPAYYRWSEWMNLHHRFHEESLDRAYDIFGGPDEDMYEDAWSAQHHRRIREQSILSRISDRYGVLYDAAGAVDSFFQLSEKEEGNILSREERFGKISEESLEYFTDFFSSDENDDKEKLFRYVQIRASLSGALVERFEKQFPLLIPNQLQRDFRTLDEFRENSEPFRESIVSSLPSGEWKKALKNLADQLSMLLHDRRESDRKEHFGVASENAENFLDFALSNIALDPEQVRPTAHGSTCYYLFVRNRLPAELVEEFEDRFHLNIPENLKIFSSYDRYLGVNDRELVAALRSGDAPMGEMREWLLENIGALKDQIQSKKIRAKKLSFQELLQQEGFDVSLLGDEDFEARYRFLLHPVFRKKIEDDFGIELKDFSVRTQMQSLNFLFEKNEEEVKKVVAFLKNGNSENRLKSFLSLEQGGEEMGKVILTIGEKLPKEAADMVFAKYVELVEASREEAKKMYSIYGDIFSSESMTEERIMGALIAEANTILRDMSETVDGLHNAVSISDSVERFSESIRRNKEARSRLLEEFFTIAQALSVQVSDLEKEYLLVSGGYSSGEEREKIAEESLRQGEKLLLEEYGSDALDRVDERESELKEWERRHQDEVIQDIIQGIEREYGDTREMLDVLGKHEIAKGTYEKMRATAEENAKKFQPMTKKLTKILKQRKRMRTAFEAVLYGREPAVLPKEFFTDFEKAVDHIRPELPVSERTPYFPVGISKELPKWERVLAGEGKSVKPIDLYNFLFWLNNQGREISIPVCDETQALNYEVLYGKTHEDALESARAIGRVEREQYERIVQTFGLSHIRIVSSKEFFKDTEKKNEKFEKYQVLLKELSETSTWREAFLGMVGESVSRQSANAGEYQEKKVSVLPYALEELALILSTNGLKLSHPNEARYDAIAVVLENMEAYVAKQGIDFFDVNEHKKLDPVLRDILEALVNRINTPRKEEQSTSGQVYMGAVRKALLSIQRPTVSGVLTKPEKKNIAFNFFPLPADSRSFGWRSAGKKGEEEQLGFKEPYSTYFPSSETDILLEDQVVAVPGGMLSGKVLMLSAEKQQEYAEHVLKPLLLHYFKSIESAPQEYFQALGETRASLLARCQKSETLSDILRFIQKHIVAPSVQESEQGTV